MAAMGGEKHEVAGAKLAVGHLALDAEPGATRDHHHPFVARLIQPFAGRRRLPGRDDALDANIRPLQQRLDHLVNERLRRQAAQQVAVAQPHQALIRFIHKCSRIGSLARATRSADSALSSSA